MKKQPLQVYVSKEVLDWLQQQASQAEVSLAQVARTILTTAKKQSDAAKKD